MDPQLAESAAFVAAIAKYGEAYQSLVQALNIPVDLPVDSFVEGFSEPAVSLRVHNAEGLYITTVYWQKESGGWFSAWKTGDKGECVRIAWMDAANYLRVGQYINEFLGGFANTGRGGVLEREV